MAKLTELNEAEAADMKRLAKALETIDKANKVVKQIGGKYVDFITEHEAELRRGVTVNGLTLSLKITKKLIAVEEA